MKITFVISLVFCVILKETTQQCFGRNDTGGVAKNVHTNLYHGQQEFSLALLNAINKLMPNENLFFSPFSTYHALLLAYFMSGKQTESYLKKALRLSGDQEKFDLIHAYKVDKLLTQFRSQNASFEFKNANKIYVSDAVPVRDCAKEAFHQELDVTDFKTNPEASRNNINAWVENITHNMIKELLPAGSIDSTTDLVLVNAAYFKAMWENKFDPDLTRQEVFYVRSDKQIMVDMMHVEGTFNHEISESLGAHIIELPYQDNNISMYILLPPFTNDSVETTLKSLTLDKFKEIVNGNLTPRTVHVALPKFSLETTVELVPILETLGVGNLFKTDSDFSALTSKKVTVAEGIHKARIEINEHGSQAAAATAIFSWRMMSDEEELYKFICNKPFVFFIFDKSTSNVLFLGIYKH